MAAEKKQDGSIDLTLSDDELPPSKPSSGSKPMAFDPDTDSDECKDMKDSDASGDEVEDEGEEFAQGSFR